MDNQLQEYAKIKAQIKSLEYQAKVMEIDIIKAVDDVAGKKLVTEFATFSLIGKKKYEYTHDLTEKEALLKEKIKFMKHEEEATGKATLLEDGWQLRCQILGGK